MNMEQFKVLQQGMTNEQLVYLESIKGVRYLKDDLEEHEQNQVISFMSTLTQIMQSDSPSEEDEEENRDAFHDVMRLYMSALAKKDTLLIAEITQTYQMYIDYM